MRERALPVLVASADHAGIAERFDQVLRAADQLLWSRLTTDAHQGLVDEVHRGFYEFTKSDARGAARMLICCLEPWFKAVLHCAKPTTYERNAKQPSGRFNLFRVVLDLELMTQAELDSNRNPSETGYPDPVKRAVIASYDGRNDHVHNLPSYDAERVDDMVRQVLVAMLAPIDRHLDVLLRRLREDTPTAAWKPEFAPAHTSIQAIKAVFEVEGVANLERLCVVSGDRLQFGRNASECGFAVRAQPCRSRKQDPEHWAINEKISRVQGEVVIRDGRQVLVRCLGRGPMAVDGAVLSVGDQQPVIGHFKLALADGDVAFAGRLVRAADGGVVAVVLTPQVASVRYAYVVTCGSLAVGRSSNGEALSLAAIGSAQLSSYTLSVSPTGLQLDHDLNAADQTLQLRALPPAG